MQVRKVGGEVGEKRLSGKSELRGEEGGTKGEGAGRGGERRAGGAKAKGDRGERKRKVAGEAKRRRVGRGRRACVDVWIRIMEGGGDFSKRVRVCG